MEVLIFLLVLFIFSIWKGLRDNDFPSLPQSEEPQETNAKGSNSVDLNVWVPYLKSKHMKSPEWNSKRKEILARDRYSCVRCGAMEALEVHHITYVRIGHEQLEDLVSLCRSCHQDIHDRYGYDFNNTFPVKG